MASLAATFGRGAMTNGWTDIRNADVVLAMGGNPAENHPVGFRFVMEAKRNRNAKLVCVDPRFNRTAAVADRFVQIRAGTDIAFLGGLIHYALTRNRYHDEYVRLFTNAPFLVSEHYAFDEKRGVFCGWDDERKSVHGQVELELRARRAVASRRSIRRCEHPRIGVPGDEAVLRALHAGDGVVDLRLQRRGLPERRPSSSRRPTRPIASGRSCTRSAGRTHSHSVQLIHAAAMLQLLLGNIGRPGGGLNALRGHANIQGGTDCGMAYHNLPGYIADPEGRPRRRSARS